ncbi:LamG-like jellyroll fold domain-containing protein [Thermoproteota archaeon]
MKRTFLLWAVILVVLSCSVSAVSFTMHYTRDDNVLYGPFINGISALDVDNDNDWDLVFGGYDHGTTGSIIYENSGSGTFSIKQTLDNPDPDSIGSIPVGDVDNNGYIDLFTSNTHGSQPQYIYKNTAGTFTKSQSINEVTYSVGSSFDDLDNDGDLDVAMSGGSNTDFTGKIYINNGSGSFTFLNNISSDVSQVDVTVDVKTADVDNDGDLDLITMPGQNAGLNKGPIAIFKNDAGSFSLFSTLVNLSDANYAIELADLNADTFQDLVVAYKEGKPTTIYLNDGIGNFAEHSNLSDSPLKGWAIALGDANNDGSTDIAVAYDERVVGGKNFILYLNDGTALFTKDFETAEAERATDIRFVDVDNDGRLDIAAGAYQNTGPLSRMRIYKNNVGAANIQPLPPSTFNSDYFAGKLTLSWGIGSDTETPDNLLMYNIMVGTTPGGQDIVSGVYGSPMKGNMHQRRAITLNIPDGTYYWSVQTIDSGLRASAWSGEQFYNGTAPSHTTPILNSSLGGNATDENLTCYPQNVNDPNGDNVTTIFNWYVDGTSLTKINMPLDINANDYSGNGFDGNVVGATLTGEGYEFDGIDDKIEVPASIGITANQERTLEAWVKPYSYSQTGYIQPILGFGTCATGELSVISTRNNGFFFWGFGEGQGNTVQGTAKPLNQWHHVVATYDGSTMRLYVNGAFEGSSDTTLNTGVSNVEIGGNYNGCGSTTYFFEGLIGEVKIYNHSLSSEQIMQNYIDSNTTQSTILSQETNEGETWSCEVTPNDGIEDGNTLNSNTLTIAGGLPPNNPPTHTTPILNSPTNATDEDLTCWPQNLDDADFDPVTAIFNWYIDSNPLMALYMPFDSNANDYSGNSNHGTITDAVLAAGKSGNAMSFDGTADYVSVGDLTTFKWMHGADNPSDFKFTISLWMQLDNPEPDDTYGLVSTEGGSSSHIGTGFWFEDYNTQGSRKLRLSIFNGVPAQYVVNYYSPDNIYPFDTGWHYVAVTYDHSPANDNVIMYVDGIEASRGDKDAAAPSTADSTYNLHIGSLGNVLDEFAGKIDDVRIYKKVLSPEQVYQEYLDSSVIVSQETAVGEQWMCEVTPNDGIEDGNTLQSNTITILPCIDIDNDNICDSEDSVIGNESDINSTDPINITINDSNNMSEDFEGVLHVEFTQGNEIIAEFDHNFSEQIINLSNIYIGKQNASHVKGFIIVSGVNLSEGQTKTLYLDRIDTNLNYICIKDTEMTDIDEISKGCNAPDETHLSCQSGQEKNGYQCTINGTQYKITGLKHSGIAQLAVPKLKCEGSWRARVGMCQFADTDGDCICGPVELSRMNDMKHGYNTQFWQDLMVPTDNSHNDLDGDGVVDEDDFGYIIAILNGSVSVNWTDLPGLPTDINIMTSELTANQNNVFTVNVTDADGTPRAGIGVEFALYDDSVPANLTAYNPCKTFWDWNETITADHVYSITGNISDGGQTSITIFPYGTGTVRLLAKIESDPHEGPKEPIEVIVEVPVIESMGKSAESLKVFKVKKDKVKKNP